MLSINYLGQLGRIGNQMFQYATLISLAKKHGYDYCLPRNDIPEWLGCEIALYDCFNLSNLDKKIKDRTDYPYYYPSCSRYDSEYVNNCPSHVDLVSYYQSDKYFSEYEDLIRKEYTFKEHILKQSQDIFYRMFYDSNVISLHVRRSDIIDDEYLNSLDISYYEKALQCFDPYLPVLIFSDDIEWCKQLSIFQHPRFKISGNEVMIDLCMMSLCNYHIIANSTLSWWGSWLAESKKTIAPRKWYKKSNIKIPRGNNYILYTNENAVWDATDIYRDDWILV